MFRTLVLRQDKIEKFKNVLTVIKPYQPFNLFLYIIELKEQHVFYQTVKLKS
jgi:hypothetical protein